MLQFSSWFLSSAGGTGHAVLPAASFAIVETGGDTGAAGCCDSPGVAGVVLSLVPLVPVRGRL